MTELASELPTEDSAVRGAASSADFATMFGMLCACFFALLAWLTPLHHFTWPSFHEEFAMALAGLIFGWLVIWRGRKMSRPIAPLAAATLLSAFIPLIQLASGLISFRGDAWLASLYLLGFALAQIIGQRAVALWGTDRLVTSFMSVILLGATASTWLALCQWQRLDYLGDIQSGLPPGFRPFANFNQPNQFATLAVLGVLSGASLFQSRHIGRETAALLLAFLGLGLATSQSRAGILELIVATVLLARSRMETRLRWPVVVSGAALVLLMSGVFMLVNAMTGEVAPRDTPEMATAGMRAVHWSSMLDAIGQRPWAGYGWSQTVLAQYAVAPVHPATGEMITYSHNLFLDLLVWNGIPIGGAIAAVLIVWFVEAWRHLRSPASLIALTCVATVFAHAMVEYPLAYLYFLLPVGLLMGAVGETAKPRKGWYAPLPVVCSALAVSAAAVLLVGRDYARLEDDVNALRFEQARIGLAHSRHQLSKPLVLTQLSAFVHFVRHRETDNMSAADLDLMGETARRFPAADNLLKYSAALALNHRPGDAVEVLRRICKTVDVDTCLTKKASWEAAGKTNGSIADIKWPS